MRVKGILHGADALSVRTDRGTWLAKAAISATGGASQPFIPPWTGRALFHGRQIHSSAYRSPDAFAGLRVLVVGGGNSGAQIRYLSSGLIRGIAPVYVRKLVRPFGEAMFALIEVKPCRLREVTGIGPKWAARIIAS